MIDYTGYECPVCGRSFRESDDIVVCPECGAPHHRECYQAHGRCGCAEQHGTEEAWDKKQAQPDTTIPCPFCGKRIADNAVFCSYCGRSVAQYTPQGQENFRQQQQQNAYGQQEDGSPYGTPPPPYGAAGNPYQPMGGVQPTDEFDGVTALNLAKLIRLSPRKYLMSFVRLKQFGRSGFNLGGLVLGGFWLLYRKDYKRGAIWGAISAVLYVAQALINALYTTPVMTNFYNELGIQQNTQITGTIANQLVNHLYAQGVWAVLLFCLPVLCYAGLIAIHIIIAVKGNRWYYDHCITTAKKIERTCATEEEREIANRKYGGVQLLFAFAFIIAHMLSSYLPAMLL